MRRIRSFFCARAASGRASAAPPTSAMNSRRLIVAPATVRIETADLKARHPIRESGAQCSFELLFGPLYHVVELLAPLREFRHHDGIDGQIVDLSADLRSGRRPG